MPIHVEIIQYSDHIRLSISGTYDLNEAVGQFSDLVALNRRTGITKMLVDFRALKGIPAATEKTLYAFGIEKQYNEHLATGGLPFQVAYLGSPPAVSTYEPGLELTKGQNLPFDIFTDENEAYRWLNIEPPSKAN